jgi:hypothetical protein
MTATPNRGMRRGRGCGTLGAVEQRAQEERAAVGTLVCLECWDESGLGRAWRAYVDTEGALLVYCPQCAAREFEA